MDFGKHPGITRKDGQECCYACECPFVETPESKREREAAELAGEPWPRLPDLSPIDDRPCVPTAAYRRRQRMMPLLNLWYLVLILITQGPRVLNNRLCWWVFGPDWRSLCPDPPFGCGGTGRIRVLGTFSPSGEPIDGPHETNCSSCNGFHD